MKDNLYTVYICNKAGGIVERTKLRINRRSLSAGDEFQAFRDKASMPKLNLRFVKATENVIYAEKR